MGGSTKDHGPALAGPASEQNSEAAEKTKLGHPPFEQRWSSTKLLRVGFLAGQGYTAVAISAALGDGTTGDNVRSSLRRAGIVRKPFASLPVPLNSYEFARLDALAGDRHMAPYEWVRQIVSASIRDDLYLAIVGQGE